jgi:pyruvate dehydrogenase E2 component (dihydrolipoamide acetyltransferase)
MEITHRIQLPAGRTLVAHSRPGEGLPVVFVHGLFGRGSDWSELAAELAQPAVAFDLPGFGGSSLPLRADLAAYAEDLAAGLDALGVDRLELVGHSFGGAVATALAGLLGDRVASLTLLAPAGFGRCALAEAATAPVLRTLARRRTATDGARVALRALVAAGRASGVPAAYSGPVTALWGSNDRVVRPAHARDLATVLPQAAVVRLDGAGHHLVSEGRDAVADLVRSGRTPRGARRDRSRRARRALRLPSPPRPRFRSEPRFA